MNKTAFGGNITPPLLRNCNAVNADQAYWESSQLAMKPVTKCVIPLCRFVVFGAWCKFWFGFCFTGFILALPADSSNGVEPQRHGSSCGFNQLNCQTVFSSSLQIFQAAAFCCCSYCNLSLWEFSEFLFAAVHVLACGLRRRGFMMECTCVYMYVCVYVCYYFFLTTDAYL